MKTFFFETDPWESQHIQAMNTGLDCAFAGEALTADNAARHAEAEAVSCFIYSALTPAVLEKMPRLRFITTRSTGFDHIDVEYCNRRGIAVANVPAYGAHTVAEHVFALLLALSRHLRQAVQQTREGNFSLSGLKGFELFGKTLGIIGTGAIGLHTIEIARGFGMRVLAHDLSPKPDAAAKLGFAYVEFDRLIAESDIISLHVPGAQATRHLLSEREFARMKDGVVIINTARGTNIDVKALLRALASGKVAGAGLDVLPNEPVIREETELLREGFAKKHDLETLLMDHALLHHKNVIVTPHSAFYTQEALERILQTTVGNLQAFSKGAPANIVNNPQAVK